MSLDADGLNSIPESSKIQTASPRSHQIASFKFTVIPYENLDICSFQGFSYSPFLKSLTATIVPKQDQFWKIDVTASQNQKEPEVKP